MMGKWQYLVIMEMVEVDMERDHGIKREFIPRDCTMTDIMERTELQKQRDLMIKIKRL